MATTKRVQVIIEAEMYDYLEKRSKNEGRKPANLAAWLLTRAIQQEIQGTTQNVEPAPRA